MQSNISLLSLSLLPQLIQDYLSGNEVVKPFYNHFPAVENFRKQLSEKSISYHNRKILSEVLQAQYQSLNVSDKTKQNLDLLHSDKTFTVTTAHQPNIFTGPLYYIYKILHAVKLSDTLKQHYPEHDFVPVYYMGCEDHDFEEINHIHLFGETLEWTDRQGGAIGRYNTRNLLSLIEKIKQKLNNEPHANEVLDIFLKGYGTHATLTQATQYIVNELFGQYGLVVLNPDEPRLKKLFSSVIKDELIHNTAFKNAALTIAELEKLNYKIQALPREINLFYLDENIRERIVFNETNNCYEVLNTSYSFSKDELIRLVDISPEKFSPNVFLRPLYQETILPNLAYVGGSGELSYWLEQKKIFEHYNTPFPVLVQRNSFTLIDAATQKKLQKISLPIEQFFNEKDAIIKNYLAQNNTLPDFSSEKIWLEKLFGEIKMKAEAIDVTLKATVDAQLQATLNGLDNLEKKLTRAEKQKQETAINQIKSIRGKFFPENNLQERYENMLPYYAKYGLQLNERLLELIEPLDSSMNLLSSSPGYPKSEVE
jgi:bacillithiol synthase